MSHKVLLSGYQYVTEQCTACIMTPECIPGNFGNIVLDTCCHHVLLLGHTIYNCLTKCLTDNTGSSYSATVAGMYSYHVINMLLNISRTCIKTTECIPDNFRSFVPCTCCRNVLLSYYPIYN